MNICALILTATLGLVGVDFNRSPTQISVSSGRLDSNGSSEITVGLEDADPLTSLVSLEVQDGNYSSIHREQLSLPCADARNAAGLKTATRFLKRWTAESATFVIRVTTREQLCGRGLTEPETSSTTVVIAKPTT